MSCIPSYIWVHPIPRPTSKHIVRYGSIRAFRESIPNYEWFAWTKHFLAVVDYFASEIVPRTLKMIGFPRPSRVFLANNRNWPGQLLLELFPLLERKDPRARTNWNSGIHRKYCTSHWTFMKQFSEHGRGPSISKPVWIDIGWLPLVRILGFGDE